MNKNLIIWGGVERRWFDGPDLFWALVELDAPHSRFTKKK